MTAPSDIPHPPVSSDAPNDLPEYTPMLAAYHRAHAAELRAMIDDLPVRLGDHVLAMPCGDGVYTVLLAEKVGLGGSVVGVDLSESYLAMARMRAEQSTV